MLNSNNMLWLSLPDFEDYYEVSPSGEIRNKRSKKILKTYTINSGYKSVKLTVQGIRTSILIHRAVALTFLSPIDGRNIVNHIDGDKQNNCLENLEWSTHSENLKHSFQLGLRTLESCRTYVGKKHANSITKYHNVGYDKSRDKYYGKVVHETKVLGFKRFDTEIEAALHVNSIIKQYQLDRPLNIIT